MFQVLKGESDWDIDLDILACGGSFELIEFSHICRKCNMVAYTFARRHILSIGECQVGNPS